MCETDDMIIGNLRDTILGKQQPAPPKQYIPARSNILENAPEVDIFRCLSQKQKEMEAAAKNLDFIKAAKIRDEILALKG